MSWFGNTLLPAVDAALRDDLGEYRRPRDTKQLAAWLRATGSSQEAAHVEGMGPRGLGELLGYFREQFRNDAAG